jgi:predicted ATPase/class 3 adenylate cyclase
MIESSAMSVTYLFSDIEGSTRLWEADPGRAARTVAWHDEVSRSAVERHRGTIVKTIGDGVHAAFEDPADAVAAVIDLQLELAEPGAERAPLKVRCGLHLGADQRRDNDFYGPAVNRAARIMSAAHGGQVLVSGAVAERVQGRLPQNVVLRDLGAVRLRDLGSPEHVFQVIHPALRKDFPPLRSMATTPNNLAQQLNSFVGRDRDMAQVQQLLASSRLLTLLGMGGLGKSRLSVQVAAVVLDNYPDGVWFVELASLVDPQLVPQAVASVLGVKEEPGGTVTDALVRFVRDRQLLIVLDNCEHVVQACAVLAKRLLEAGSKVQVVASSRDSLRIAGEIVFAVAPLPAPVKDETTSIDALMAIDSVRLFIDRAKAIQPGFRLDENSVRAVAEICRRLDGIPLAIELAAARVRTMSVEQIAARLDDRFRLLSRGDRTALPRQQTLRALIDWSHDLLDAKERVIFRRLAVFAGGWTIEAAEAVACGGEVTDADVLDLLSELVEKSLVVIDAEGGRYRMLDTVRQYALESLQTSPDEAATRERHLGFYVGYVESAHPHLLGSQQGAWMRRLDVESENIFSAHQWCDKSPSGAESDVRLISALKYYWLNRGLLGHGYSIAKDAIGRKGLADLAERHARGLVDTGTIATFIGRYAEAREHFERGLQIARRLQDSELHFVVLQYLGEVEFSTGNRQQALMHAEEAEALARSAEKPRMLAAALNARGQLLRVMGEFQAARLKYEEALKLFRELSDDENIVVAVLNLAITAVLTHESKEAHLHLREALRIQREIGSQAAGQAILEIAAGLAAETGDWMTATEFVNAAEAQAARSGLRRDPADQAFVDSTVSRIQRAPDAAGGDSSIGKDLAFDLAMHRVARWLETNTSS